MDLKSPWDSNKQRDKHVKCVLGVCHHSWVVFKNTGVDEKGEDQRNKSRIVGRWDSDCWKEGEGL